MPANSLPCKMKPPRAVMSVIVFLSLFLPQENHAQVILPLTSTDVGTATGSSGPVSFGGMFDAQPATIPTAGDTVDNFGTAYGFFNSANVGRVGYIDFGADFSLITIEQTFVGVRQFGANPTGTLAITYWWSPDTSATFDSGTGDVLLGQDIGLFSIGTPDSDKQWVQTFSGSIAPQARYLIVAYSTASTGDRQAEVVLIGTVVPEATAAAFLIGGLAMGGLLRRRALRLRATRPPVRRDAPPPLEL